MGAEELAIAVLAAEFDGLGRAPAVAADNRAVPAQVVGLLYDQGYLVVVLRSKQDLRIGADDFGQLLAEIGILGGEAFIGDHGAGAVLLFPGGFEEFSQTLGIVAGNVIQNGSLGKAEFLGNKVG